MKPPANDAVRRLRDDRGIALIISLMAMFFMMALGTALMLSTTIETRIANNLRHGSGAFYAADAGLERSMDDLLTITDWNAMLAGTATSVFTDGAPGERVLADGTTLDLHQVLAYANCQKAWCTTADYIAVTTDRPWGMNNPRWQLFAHGRLDHMLPAQSIVSPFYVVVMVGDDPSENDDDPLKDGAAETNPGAGVVALRAEAFGPFGVRKVVELTVARADESKLEGGHTNTADDNRANGPAGVRILSWRELR